MNAIDEMACCKPECDNFGRPGLNIVGYGWFATVASLRVEGVSISATARVTGRSRTTIARWLERASTAATRFNQRMLRDFDILELQADELCTFIGSKRSTVWLFANRRPSGVEGGYPGQAKPQARRDRLGGDRMDAYTPMKHDFGDPGRLEREIADLDAMTSAVEAFSWRDPHVWLSATIFLIGLVVGSFGAALVPGSASVEPYLPLLGFGVSALAVLYPFARAVSMASRRAGLNTQRARLDARRKVLFNLGSAPSQELEPGAAESETDTPYFDRLVRINVDNLAAYYALVKEHTDKSFRVSVAVGVIGFILIAAGLVAGFVDTSGGTQGLTYISTGAGVVTEFIAGVFFILYNRTVR